MLWFLLAIFFVIVAHMSTKSRSNRDRPNPNDYGTTYSYEYDLRRWRNKWEERRFWHPLVAFFVCSAIAVALNMFFDGHSRIPEDRYTTLYSMNDAIGAKGRFYLGGGSVDAAPVYTYYYKDNNQYRLTYKYSRNSYITYSDGTPQLIHHGSRQRYSNWFSIGKDDWRVDLYSETDPYEFQVPEGSIQQGVSLDAQ